MEYTRICPNCKKTVYHKTKYSRNQIEKANKSCSSCVHSKIMNNLTDEQKKKQFRGLSWVTGEPNPFQGKKHTQETKNLLAQKSRGKKSSIKKKQKLSVANSGVNNPMYGKSYYDVWVIKYGEEKAKELQSAKIKKHSELSSGANNPMYGKPSPNGSGNGWSGWYKDWFFRSLRELSYVVNLEKSGIGWKSAGDVKIHYEFNGSKRTYTPDFLVGHKLVEVKPRKLIGTPNVQAKQDAAIDYCESKNLEYEIVDVNLLELDELIKLHESGIVKFTKRYEQKFSEYKEKL